MKEKTLKNNQAVTIIYSRYIEPKSKTLYIGGVETYITNLSSVLLELGAKVRVVQMSDESFSYTLPSGVLVQGFVVSGKKNKEKFQNLFDAAKESEKEENLIIFATDSLIPEKTSGHCIAIQHGISWDIPKETKKSLLRQVFSKALGAYQIVKRVARVEKLVCVDYNFVNWYRAQVFSGKTDTVIIPNFTEIAKKTKKPSGVPSIIFARRLCSYRGTRVFTQAIEQLLKEGFVGKVTIAGSGPDEAYMKERLSAYPNVEWIYYESHESLKIHKSKHIAVVPTVGSEGTSLSLLEAMSAGCAVICSDVGGMTSIVLDGFNGLMVPSGSEDALYEALKKLIENETLRVSLAKRGYETVKEAFSLEKWKESWKGVLQKYLKDK